MDTKYYAVSEGFMDGLHYVTVLDENHNPIEYNITTDEATRRYGIEF